jgi:hypothetical protein
MVVYPEYYYVQYQPMQFYVPQPQQPLEGASDDTPMDVDPSPVHAATGFPHHDTPGFLQDPKYVDFLRQKQQKLCEITRCNIGSGTCGFLAVLAAVVDFKPQLMDRFPDDTFPTIQRYLQNLKKTNPALYKKILIFTKSFVGNEPKKDSVENGIYMLEHIFNVNLKAFFEDNMKFNIAMPPDAVKDFIGFLRGDYWEIGPHILGLNAGDGMYNGLRHWMYRDCRGRVYTNGKICTLDDLFHKGPYTDWFQLCSP